MKTKSKSKSNSNNPPLSVAVVLGLYFAILLSPISFVFLPDKYERLCTLIGGGLALLWFAASCWVLVEMIIFSRKERIKTMTPKEFEAYLVSLSSDNYDKLMQERIAKLSPEDQTIMQAREIKRKKLVLLIEQARKDPTNDETQQRVLDHLLNEHEDNCEHERSIFSHCLACGKLDHDMFPELFDEYGDPLEEDNRED